MTCLLSVQLHGHCLSNHMSVECVPLNQTTYSPVCRSNGMGPTTGMSCSQQPWRLNGKSVVGPNAMSLNVPFNRTIYSPVCRSNGMAVEWDVGCRLNGMVVECYAGCRSNAVVVARSNAMLVQWDVSPVTCRLNGPFNRTIYSPVFEHEGGLVVYMKHGPSSQVIMLQGIYSPVKWHGA
jgi:hypothetical protein